MTATLLREDNRDTYEYFGNPIYQYSLRQGIEDGFLAPYRVHRRAEIIENLAPWAILACTPSVTLVDDNEIEEVGRVFL